MKGLSICIPVYNYDATPLVKSLANQIQFLGSQVEIIIFDDNSDISFCHKNRELKAFDKVHYVELLHNVGRAAIRNKMATVARFSHLLFIDVDSLPVNENYIERYWKHHQEAKVIIGGTAYYPKAPEALFLLRWRYGKAREVKLAEYRNRAPYSALALNNVMVEKECFLSYPLNEAIVKYGHEDTLWGEALAKDAVKVLHTDNPVFHLGLEPNERFLEKQLEACLQLKHLIDNNLGGTSTRLYQFAHSTKGKLLENLINLIPNKFLERLILKHSNLLALDFLKFKYFTGKAK